MLWTISIFFAALCLVLWKKSIDFVIDRNNPVISFSDDHVTFLTSVGELISMPLVEIWGVEVENIGPSYGGGHILISRQNSQSYKIYISNLGAVPKDVFLAFKERLPHLRQPHSNIRRLIHAA
jgi:hypothetical protein